MSSQELSSARWDRNNNEDTSIWSYPNFPWNSRLSWFQRSEINYEASDHSLWEFMFGGGWPDDLLELCAHTSNPAAGWEKFVPEMYTEKMYIGLTKSPKVTGGDADRIYDLDLP